MQPAKGGHSPPYYAHTALAAVNTIDKRPLIAPLSRAGWLVSMTDGLVGPILFVHRGVVPPYGGDIRPNQQAPTRCLNET